MYSRGNIGVHACPGKIFNSYCIATRGHIRCVKNWLSVKVSVHATMSTHLYLLFPEAQIGPLSHTPLSQREKGLCNRTLKNTIFKRHGLTQAHREQRHTGAP